ncbi:MAG: TonB-dependent receptor [Emticicia sp.]|nr:TonB-dependent receptor [Emticicia sp.]
MKVTSIIAFVLSFLVIQMAEAKKIEPKTHVIVAAVSGKVTDARGDALAGVGVVIKGTTKGTTTDGKGTYSIDVTGENATLVFSFIGFIKKEVLVGNQTVINVSLEENDQSLDEIVVTGVFDARTRLEASTAISIMKTKDIERMAATSGVDYLKNIPGIFVNASQGEVRNQISTRGLPVGGPQSYNYYSMQEDGLPIMNVNFGIDHYLKPDAATGRIEVLRGGSASITSPNAPGGTFNYISKTGGDKLEGLARVKFGLEGDGKNPYYRADLNYGGPLSKDKSLRFNIGGFYRESDGPRYAGYSANNGGQVRANITKSYRKGSVKLYTKYLNDRNQINAQTPLTNWGEQTPPPGFDYLSSFDIPLVKGTVNRNGVDEPFDSGNKFFVTEKNVGLSWNHQLAEGLELRYSGRYTDKTYNQNGTTLVTPYLPTSAAFYSGPSLTNRYGVYTFTDNLTGEFLGTFDRQRGKPVVPGENNKFPGFNNQVLNMPLFQTKRNTTDFMNQISISKRLKKMSFTAGAFQARTTGDAIGQNTSSGTGIATIENQPRLIAISLASTDGKTYQVTSPLGFAKEDAAGQNTLELDQKMFSVFLAHDWSITDKLNLDWGVRYENINNKGWNALTVAINAADAVTFGGRDNNPLTLYDNFGGTPATPVNYDKTVKYFAFSGGLNYKITDNQAVYFRYSNGGKSPDINTLFQLNNQFNVDNTNAEDLTQKLTQVEFAYKYSSAKFKLFVTPFVSILNNVASISFFRNADNTSYAAPVLFNSFNTKGIEIETNIALTNKFSLRASALFQKSIATKFETWIANANGPQDDTKSDYSGNETSGIPPLTLNIAPTYSTDKFYATLSYNHLAKRQANNANGFKLRGFNNFDLTSGYDVSKRLSLQFNVNNVFNQFGILQWLGSGGFPTSRNTERITAEYVAANPNDVFSGLTNMPRAYFLTANFKF